MHLSLHAAESIGLGLDIARYERPLPPREAEARLTFLRGLAPERRAKLLSSATNRTTDENRLLRGFLDHEELYEIFDEKWVPPARRDASWRADRERRISNLSKRIARDRKRLPNPDP
jgi:hypothetical protein